MYGYGLLGLNPEQLYEMDVRDFCDMVNGKLGYESLIKDADREYLSHLAGSIMLSSGNYKRGTKIDKIKQTLYIPLRDREMYERRNSQLVGADGRPIRSNAKCDPKDVQRIKEHFGIKDEDTE